MPSRSARCRCLIRQALVEVRIAGGNRGFGVNPGRYVQLTRPVWEELRKHQQSLDGMFAWGMRELRVGERTNLRAANGIAVSGGYFGTLGVTPHRGRLIEPADEMAACPATVAVVSYAILAATNGGQRADSPARLRVNLDLVDVVGVAEPGFFGVAVGESFDVALPLCQPNELRRELFDIAVMGRLRPGWTNARASEHLDALSAGIFEADGSDRVQLAEYRALQVIPPRGVPSGDRRERAADTV